MTSREEYFKIVDTIHYYKLSRSKLCELMVVTEDPEYHIEIMKLDNLIKTLEEKKFKDFTNGVPL